MHRHTLFPKADRSAFSAGYSSGWRSFGEFDQRQRRRRERLSDRSQNGSGVPSDLSAVWRDFVIAIEKEAGKFFRQNYEVWPEIDESGDLQFKYRLKPQNKKMEDAGGWGK